MLASHIFFFALISQGGRKCSINSSRWGTKCHSSICTDTLSLPSTSFMACFLWLQQEMLPPYPPHQLCQSGSGQYRQFSEVLQGSGCHDGIPNTFCSQPWALAVCLEKVGYHFPANIFCVYIYIINTMNIKFSMFFHLKFSPAPCSFV